MDSISQLVGNTDLDFFWHMMGNLGPMAITKDETAHEQAMDDACATFMAGCEL